MRRIANSNVKERMPPASTGRKLSEGEIALLRRWIDQGAKWQKHWSLIPPQRPSLPAIKQTDDAIPYTMVAEEMAEPRPAHVLVRGDFLKKGDKVDRAVPAVFPALPAFPGSML